MHRRWLALLLCLPAVLFAQAPDTLWTRHYGGAGDEFCYRVRPTLDGGFILVGSTTSATAGGKDAFAAMTSASGTLIWSRRFGGPRDDEFRDVVPLNVHEFLMAGTTASYGAGGEDFWLVRVSYAGDSLWSQTYGARGDQHLTTIQATSDGGYIMAGNMYPFMETRADIDLIKTDASGGYLWATLIGDTENDAAAGIVQFPQGGYLVVGEHDALRGSVVGSEPYAVGTNSTGSPIWEQHYVGLFPAHAAAVRQALVSGYIVAGWADRFPNGDDGRYKESLVMKIDAEGLQEWLSPCGMPFDDELHDIAPLGGNSYVGAGTHNYLNQPLDGFLVKLNLQGDTLWTTTVGGGADDGFETILPWTNGKFAVAGYTRSETADSNADMWLVMMDSVAAASADVPAPASARQFSLWAYPNPFNSATRIEFDLPKAGRAVLRVFDTNGREVATLLNGPLSSGLHAVPFDAGGLPSGLYFCRLSAAQGSQVEKIMVMK